jgi:predicted Fe-S protein YdhL (DUF1289 family)
MKNLTACTTKSFLGKFEAEPCLVEYYWGLGLEGLAEREAGSAVAWRICSSDLDTDEICDGCVETLSERVGEWLMLWEDEQGFVSHMWVQNDAALESIMLEYGENDPSMAVQDSCEDDNEDE